MDVGVILALFVFHAVAIRHPAHGPAGLKAAVRKRALESHENQRFKWRVAVAACPQAVPSADGPREPVGGPLQIQRAGLAIIRHEDACTRSLVGGQRLIDARHLFDQIRPADHLAKVVTHPVGNSPGQRVDRCDWQHQEPPEDGAGRQQSNEHAAT